LSCKQGIFVYVRARVETSDREIESKVQKSFFFFWKKTFSSRFVRFKSWNIKKWKFWVKKIFFIFTIFSGISKSPVAILSEKGKKQKTKTFLIILFHNFESKTSKFEMKLLWTFKTFFNQIEFNYFWKWIKFWILKYFMNCSRLLTFSKMYAFQNLSLIFSRNCYLFCTMSHFVCTILANK
jgi:hypothetical protein